MYTCKKGIKQIGAVLYKWKGNEYGGDGSMTADGVINLFTNTDMSDIL